MRSVRPALAVRRPQAVVAVLLGALLFYFGLIGYRGVFLVTRPQWTLKVLGVAVLVLPLIGLWVVVAEVRFGRQAQRLTAELSGPAADGLPAADRPDGAGGPLEIPRRPSGRVDRVAADAIFARQRAEVEADPGDWRGWYRLAEAYDVAGDRRRARAAMRTAIARHAPPAG